LLIIALQVAQIQKARAVAANKAKKQQKKLDGIRPKYVSLTEEAKRIQERIATYQKDLKRATAVSDGAV
jgi:phosphoserine phosphatase